MSSTSKKILYCVELSPAGLAPTWMCSTCLQFSGCDPKCAGVVSFATWPALMCLYRIDASHMKEAVKRITQWLFAIKGHFYDMLMSRVRVKGTACYASLS